MKKLSIVSILCSILLLTGCYHTQKNNPSIQSSQIEKKPSKKVADDKNQATSQKPESVVSSDSNAPKSSNIPSPQSSTSSALQDLDIQAINQNDLSSLVGTWQNGAGEVLVIQPDGSTNTGYHITGVADSANHVGIPYANYSYGEGQGARVVAALTLFKIGFHNPDGDYSDSSKPRLALTQNTMAYPAEVYYYRK